MKTRINDKWYLQPPKYSKDRVRLLTQYSYIALLGHKHHFVKKDIIQMSESEWDMLGQCHSDLQYDIGSILVFPESLGNNGYYVVADVLYAASKTAAYSYRLIYLGNNIWLQW